MIQTARLSVILSFILSFDASAFRFEDIETAPTQLDAHHELNYQRTLLNFEHSQEFHVLSEQEQQLRMKKLYDYIYKNHSHSLINWSELDPLEWMSFDAWKIDRQQREQNEQWRRVQRESGLIETFGRVLSCVGSCQVHRFDSSIDVRHRTRIDRGDELVTLKDSYAWIFLFDGTLIRVAPLTHLVFQEVNIGLNKNFFQLRLAKGEMTWISRGRFYHQDINLRETDPLFLPLPLWEANLSAVALEKFQGTRWEDQKSVDYFQFFSQRPRASQLQVQRLNQKIKENNKKFSQKKTHLMLVTPHITIEGEDPFLQVVSLPRSGTYAIDRSPSSHSLVTEDDFDRPFLTGFYRGFNNTESFQLPPDEWIKMDITGRSYQFVADDVELNFSKMLTRRIPSLMIARELWLRLYGKPFYNISDPSQLASYGYRLWEYHDFSDPQHSDLSARIAFLREYTRRLETSQLTVQSHFIADQHESYLAEYKNYSFYFYDKAYSHYVRSLKISEDAFFVSDDFLLESEKRPLWKQLQVIGAP